MEYRRMDTFAAFTGCSLASVMVSRLLPMDFVLDKSFSGVNNLILTF